MWLLVRAFFTLCTSELTRKAPLHQIKAAERSRGCLLGVCLYLSSYFLQGELGFWALRLVPRGWTEGNEQASTEKVFLNLGTVHILTVGINQSLFTRAIFSIKGYHKHCNRHLPLQFKVSCWWTHSTLVVRIFFKTELIKNTFQYLLQTEKQSEKIPYQNLIRTEEYCLGAMRTVGDASDGGSGHRGSVPGSAVALTVAASLLCGSLSYFKIFPCQPDRGSPSFTGSLVLHENSLGWGP